MVSTTGSVGYDLRSSSSAKPFMDHLQRINPNLNPATTKTYVLVIGLYLYRHKKAIHDEEWLRLISIK
ncbi:MAG: hypothetical protein CMP48_20550 [Rickettsiales bacterium]|nr:hypothetical protein [Rickettsiales bacterium]